MTLEQFRIESDLPFTSHLLPLVSVREEYRDWKVAVAVAAKCITRPPGYEVRVVGCSSGEIVFRTHPRAGV